MALQARAVSGFCSTACTLARIHLPHSFAALLEERIERVGRGWGGGGGMAKGVWRGQISRPANRSCSE